MAKNILVEYAELMIAKRNLEEQIKLLAPKVIEAMPRTEVPVDELGTLVIIERKDYIYSDYIEKKEEVLAEEKAEARRLGDYTVVTTPSLRFNTKKDDKDL
jgi:hypothetical protein